MSLSSWLRNGTGDAYRWPLHALRAGQDDVDFLDRGGAAMTSGYSLGREYTPAEALVIARRATFDPGVFCGRLTDHNGPEELHRWQARAVVIALGPGGPAHEPKWSNLDHAVRNLDDHEIEALES